MAAEPSLQLSLRVLHFLRSKQWPEPPHIHTIITSRELPQMPLARWRVRGQLTVIDAPALQFTVTEVGRFLREGVKLNLTDPDIARLTAQTEGWIGALQLMALSLQVVLPALVSPTKMENAGFILLIAAMRRSNRA